MNIALINIYDNENYKTNLNVDQDFFILWNNYEIFKIKLREYNEAIEALTIEVLKLRLSNDKDKNAKKNFIKDDVSKIINYKKEFQEDNELLILYKLLSIKLRCLRIEKKLYEENCYLKILLEKSNKFVQYRKQQLLNKINQSTENLAKSETYFTTKFKSLFYKLHSNQNKVISKQHLNTDLTNHYIDQYTGKENNFQFSSKNSNNKLNFKIKLIINNFQKEISNYLSKNVSSNNFDVALHSLLFNKNIRELPISWIVKENGFIEIELAIENLQSKTKKTNNNTKYVYELDRTENKNSKYTSEIRNSNLQLMKHNKINNLNMNENIICVSIPKVTDIKSKLKKIKNMFTTANKVIQLHFEKINLYSFIIDDESINKNFSQKIYSEDLHHIRSTVNLNNLITNISDINNLNNYVQTEQSIQKIDTIYNLDKINEFLLNYKDIKDKILNSYLNTHQLNTFIKTNTIGIGESTALLFNQEVQVKDDYLPEINEISSNEKDIISSATEITTFTKKPESFDFYTKIINVSKTERKKYKKNIFSSYNKSNYTFNKMPEMGKIYQIVLQNKAQEGINFQFLKSNKQIFLINSSNKTDTL